MWNVQLNVINQTLKRSREFNERLSLMGTLRSKIQLGVVLVLLIDALQVAKNPNFESKALNSVDWAVSFKK